MTEIEKLAELSEKAAQGEWRVRRSSPQHIDVYAAPFEDADFVASELSPQVVAGIGLDYMPNADFIVALVNWFRANIRALQQSPARVAEGGACPRCGEHLNAKGECPVIGCPLLADRPCTCHPDDNPPVPCPKKYALTACRKAAPESPAKEQPGEQND